MSEPLLSVEGLRVSFLTAEGEIEAVRGVDFSVGRGEILGLVGESGSGKSTAVKSVLRLMGPPAVIRAGSARFDGHELLSQDPSVIANLRWSHLSIVMQSALNALNPVLTIGEQLTDALLAPGTISKADALQTAREFAELVELPAHTMDAHPHELSGGMRQRVCLAMALLAEPDLIVMDEPTTALDVLVERAILRRVLELQRRLHFAIVFITHDLELLTAFADRIAVMEDGSIVEVGTVEELRSDAQHATTRALLTAMPKATGPRDGSIPVPRPVGGSPLMHANDLHMVFGGGLMGGHQTRAVNGVSLELRPGETLALVGESGSGKSTIGRMIGGLQRPTSGTIHFDGEAVTPQMNRAMRRRIQFVFQDPFASLNPAHPIGRQLVRLVRANQGASPTGARAEAARLMQRVGLDESLLDRHPHGLSGGQRQRVAIARALVTKPDLIIADEPTSMLDVSIRLGVLQLFQRLQAELGVAILLITHDLAVARYFSHRVAVLQAGHIVEEGHSEAIISNPTHPYALDLLKASGADWTAMEASS